MNFSTPISQLTKVGKTTALKLKRLGLLTAGDLLYYFPFRYEDYRRIAPINALKDGELVTVSGQVELIANKRSFRRRKIITEALVSDKSGSARVVWFNQPYIIKLLQNGDKVFLSGKVKTDMLGPQLVNPTYEKVRAGEAATHTGRLVPIYPLTQGVTEKQIRFLVSQAVPLAKFIPEWLPDFVLDKFDLTPLPDALFGVHFPSDERELKQCTVRLKFDELLMFQLTAELSRLNRSTTNAPTLQFKEEATKRFVKSLPFALTGAQKVAAWEILQDIQKPFPMNRMLSGDVGSGKTVVAAMAMYSAVLNGYQAALMAPTEILAQQHFNSIQKLFEKLNIQAGLLTANHETAAGSVDVIVGTHALLSEGVKFKKLGLVIVDEQHRFGVEQRKVMKEKGRAVHFLSMTATPIPRSLALTLYGDLDLSIINELPLGRKKIITRLVEPIKRDKAYHFIRDQVKAGRQVFVVCPLIEGESDKKSVLSEYKKLAENIFPDLRIGYLHGKLKPKEKEAAMQKFKEGKIDVLVSTSVVEVGVDIPNASVMMIEGADRFGLAQLHQFRGRVGRSTHQSYCLLFTDSGSTRSLERLKYFEQNHDGFKLAEKDLQMRGPGEVYGVEQSGMMQLRLATLMDKEIIKIARQAASELAKELSKYPKVETRVKAWQKKVHLE